jgi:hypothetical protein
MPGSFKNKLLQYETVPPVSAWNRISTILDDEYISSDSVISSAIEKVEVYPPSDSWTEIESFLDGERKYPRPALVIPLFYKQLAIAILLASVITFAAMNLFPGVKINKSSEMATIIKNNAAIKTVGSGILPVPSPAAEIAAKPINPDLERIVGTRPSIYARRAVLVTASQPEPQENINQVYFSNLQTVKADQPVNISAPSIRDAGGNIIMDVKLLSKLNDPYIIITCPNGSQTKISNKFLKCLSYLNGDLSADDTDYDGILWKEKFKSWRDKLLNENSFIPSTSNFFDIFVMKDMIQE